MPRARRMMESLGALGGRRVLILLVAVNERTVRPVQRMASLNASDVKDMPGKYSSLSVARFRYNRLAKAVEIRQIDALLVKDNDSSALDATKVFTSSNSPSKSLRVYISS